MDPGWQWVITPQYHALLPVVEDWVVMQGIVGIPLAMQHIKLLPLALLPFGRVVRDMETGREYP